MQDPVLKLHNVTKKIGKKTIIDNLSFDVPKGEVFGFLGPNGAGKTTTIRMIVGLMSLSSGDIFIGGHCVAKSFEKAMRHVGAIVENPEMYKFLSGYDNLIHFARMTPGVTKERIEEVIELVGLENRIYDKVKTYSLGMRQRLGVAQALLHKPSLLILDEPTNGLDPAGIRELRDYLRKLTREEGISVVVSSHLLSEMELMCDRVAIIQNGKLIDVKRINEYTGSSDENAAFLFEVDHAEGALAAVAANMPGITASSSPEGLFLEAVRDIIPDVDVLLVQHGIKVYGIRNVAKTLEDQFLEMTRGEKIV